MPAIDGNRTCTTGVSVGGHSVSGVPLYHEDVREFANSIVADLRQRGHEPT